VKLVLDKDIPRSTPVLERRKKGKKKRKKNRNKKGGPLTVSIG
jgi:hypothetical protein